MTDDDFMMNPALTASFGDEEGEGFGAETMLEANGAGGEDTPDLGLVMDIPVNMQVVLGTATMPVGNLVKLSRGSVVKLETRVGEPVDVIVNGRTVARGEIVILEKEEQRFGITLTEIVKHSARAVRN